MAKTTTAQSKKTDDTQTTHTTVEGLVLTHELWTISEQTGHRRRKCQVLDHRRCLNSSRKRDEHQNYTEKLSFFIDLLSKSQEFGNALVGRAGAPHSLLAGTGSGMNSDLTIPLLTICQPA